MERNPSQQGQISHEHSEPFSFESGTEPAALPHFLQTQHKVVSLSSLAQEEYSSATPLLDVIDETSNLHNFASFHCLAVMAYPHDPKARDEFLVTIKSVVGGEVRDALQSSQERDLMAALLGHWLDPHGGFHSLTKARGWDTIERDFSNTAWPGAIAGDLLKWVVRLAYWAPPASISKAFHLEEAYLQNARSERGKQGAHSKRSIIGAWTKYRPVVHLWAAFRLWQFYYGDTTGHGPDNNGPDWCSPVKGIPGFLAHAEIFRRICVSLYAHGQVQPILDPIITWRVPENLRLPNLPLAIPSLEDWSLQALESYHPERPLY